MSGIPPVSGRPVDPSKKAEDPKKVGGEEPKTSSVKDLAKNLNIPLSRPAPIKKAVPEAPPKEQGEPVGDSGIKLPPPPTRIARGRMPLPSEMKTESGPLPPAPFAAPPADRPPVLPRAQEPPPARAGRALPKTPAQPGGGAMLDALKENKLFSKQQKINYPDQANKFLHDLAKQNNHEFLEDGTLFINLTTQDVLSADQFRLIVREDTSEDYDLALKLQSQFEEEVRPSVTPEQQRLNHYVKSEAESQGFKLASEGHFYTGNIDKPQDIKTAEEFFHDMKVKQYAENMGGRNLENADPEFAALMKNLMAQKEQEEMAQIMKTPVNPFLESLMSIKPPESNKDIKDNK